MKKLKCSPENVLQNDYTQDFNKMLIFVLKMQMSHKFQLSAKLHLVSKLMKKQETFPRTKIFLMISTKNISAGLSDF